MHACPASRVYTACSNTFFRVHIAGQLFIVHTIQRFGALLFAGVMTTRQFLSILVSSAVFGNPLSPGQWCGPASHSPDRLLDVP